MTTTTVPGDPGGIRSAASVLGDTSEDAEAVVSKLKNLHDCSGDSMWRGPAADAFRAKLGELPDKLVKLRDSYGIASDALYRFANDVDQLQDEAGAAEQTETWAEDQVDFREREKQDAEICYPDADLSAYDQAIYSARQKLCAAKEEVAQVGESYRAAEDRCIASLNDASDAGIENTFFGTVLQWLAFIDKVATVLVVVLLAAAVVALIVFGGPAFMAVMGVLTVVGMVSGAVTFLRWMLGDEVAASDLVFAALAFIPVGGIAVKLLKTGAGLLVKSATILKAARAIGSRLPLGVQIALKVFTRLNKANPGFDATVAEFLLTTSQFLIPPFGPVTSLPGILERLFAEPASEDSDQWSTEAPVATQPTFPAADDEPGSPENAPEASSGSPTGPSAGPSATGVQSGSGQASSGSTPAGPASPSGPSQGAAGPLPSGPSDDVLTPEPGGDGGGCEPAPLAQPAAGGSTPGAGGAEGPLVECGPGYEPVPLPAPGQQAPLGDPAIPLGPPASDVITFTLSDGTIVTIDPPGDGGGGGESCDTEWSSERQAPGAEQEGELREESTGPDTNTSSDRDSAFAGARPGAEFDRQEPMLERDAFGDSGDRGDGERADAADRRLPGSGSAGSSPGPQDPWPPPRAGAPAPGPAPEPVAAEAESLATQDAPAPASPATLASAKPKMPLGSPLLIGGLAAGGLIGGGAAYVITEARHKMRKEEEEELPLPQPVGLRF